MSQSKKTLAKLSSEMDKRLDAFFNDLTNTIKEETPVRTGRAQRGWRKTNKYKAGQRTSQIIIRNDVPYSPNLDRGSSSQAPNGMVKPALYKGKYR